MTAKRLGSALTNITGTAKQLLRVTAEEDGLEFVTPATIPSYTVSNASTARTIDASNTTLDGMANTLGTLLNDLQAAGLTSGSNGISAFQWSLSEQIYPFEKDVDGGTIYAMKLAFNMGSTSAVAYTGITNFKGCIRHWGNIYRYDEGFLNLPVVFAGSFANYDVSTRFAPDGSYVALQCDISFWSGQPVEYYLLYTKTA